MTPYLQKTVKSTTTFILVLPSGDGLRICLHEDTSPEDTAFIERVLEIACEERKKGEK